MASSGTDTSTPHGTRREAREKEGEKEREEGKKTENGTGGRRNPLYLYPLHFTYPPPCVFGGVLLVGVYRYLRVSIFTRKPRSDKKARFGNIAVMKSRHHVAFLLLPLLLMYAKALELSDFTVTDGHGHPYSLAKLKHTPVSSSCACQAELFGGILAGPERQLQELRLKRHLDHCIPKRWTRLTQ